MNHRIRLERLHHGRKELVVGHVAHVHLNRVSGELLPDLQPFGKRTDRCESLRSKFVVPLAAEKIVDDRDGVPLARKIQSRSPTAIAVAPKNGNPHVLSSVFELFARVTPFEP